MHGRMTGPLSPNEKAMRDLEGLSSFGQAVGCELREGGRRLDRVEPQLRPSLTLPHCAANQGQLAGGLANKRLSEHCLNQGKG